MIFCNYVCVRHTSNLSDRCDSHTTAQYLSRCDLCVSANAALRSDTGPLVYL